MRVSVFGLGYVGCVTAVQLADFGHKVVGVDINKDKVGMLNSSVAPIVEPGLEEMLARVVGSGHLRATTSCADAIAASDIALVCVGTPSHANGAVNLEALERVCRSIGRELGTRRGPYTVVIRSTMLPGTTGEIVMPALRSGAGNGGRADLTVAVNPEFMREGDALRDFIHPPFTLVGCEVKAAAWQLRELYSKVDAQFVHTSVRTAEMVKYAANCFHALKISFANEIGDVCDALRVDAREVMRVFCLDHKLNISDSYLKPGFAFGGSCLPKDLRALSQVAHRADVDIPIIGALLPANAARIRKAVEQILATGRRRIGVLGLAFKSGTDDLRESPMVAVVESLIGKGLQLRILDHNVAVARLFGANRRYIDEEIPHIAGLMCQDAESLLAHAEVLVVGNNDEQSAAVLMAAKPGQIVIDLTRSPMRQSYALTGTGTAECPLVSSDSLSVPQPLSSLR